MKILTTMILIYILATGCANIQAPPGGSGDTTAPYVEYTYPKNKTINFDENTVSIGFDGYMNRSKVIENLRISPDVKMSYDWSATELNIRFEEPLQANTTYALSLGTDYTDYYNNAPEKAFSIIFSTGSKLDSGSISGKLSARDPKGKYIFLYRAKDGDFPDMELESPDYFTSTGKTGEFQIVALKPGRYRLLAVDDKFQNHKYDDEIDGFGTAMRDVTLTEDTLSVSGLMIYLGEKTDKTAPKMVGATSQFAGMVNVTFDENLDISTIRRENFTLWNGENSTPIGDIGINRATSSEVILTFDKGLMGQTLKLEGRDLADSAGNKMAEASGFVEFKADSAYNNETFAIVSTNLNDSTQKDFTPNFNLVNEKTSFNVKFSKIPDKSTLDNSAYLETNSGRKEIKLLSDDLLDYYFVTDSSIAENAEFTLVFDTKGIRDLWGNNIGKDTVYRTKFKTGFAPKYSKLSGTVELQSACSGNVVVRANNIKDKTNYKAIVTNGVWELDKVTKGTYVFEVYCDADKDGEYSFGSVKPFAFREPYSKSREYQVQENWEYNDIKLKLDE
jgi:hypothetical protein